MKLNNHGWGMRDMIIYTCIMLLLLLFVAVSINSLYKSIDISNNHDNVDDVYEKTDETKEDNMTSNEDEIINYDYYYSLENKVKSATLRYVNENRYDLSNEILNISLDTLINLNYIEQLYDENHIGVCTGYSNVSLNNDGSYSVTSRINCGNYVSEGY